MGCLWSKPVSSTHQCHEIITCRWLLMCCWAWYRSSDGTNRNHSVMEHNLPIPLDEDLKNYQTTRPLNCSIELNHTAKKYITDRISKTNGNTKFVGLLTDPSGKMYKSLESRSYQPALVEQKKPGTCGGTLHSLAKRVSEAAGDPTSSQATAVVARISQATESGNDLGNSITPASTDKRIERAVQPPAYGNQ